MTKGWFGLKKWFKPAAVEKPDLLLESLQNYLRDPAERDQFYKRLCESDVYVINHSTEAPQRDAKTGAVTHAYSFKTPFVESKGKQWVVIFSALPLLGAYVKGETRWLAMNALELFAILPEVNILLNPGSESAAELSKEDIQKIRKKYNQKYST